MKIKIPKPDKQFLQTAKKLKELIKNEETLNRSTERRRCETLLRQKFEEAFGLSPDQRKVAQRLYYRFINSKIRPKHEIFDHVSFWQRDGNLVIVSQPYGIEVGELKRWAAECGASCTIANEWGYYYPGRASLFFVEFTPQAKADLDKRAWKN